MSDSVEFKKNDAVFELIKGTALKTLACALCAIIMLTAAVAFVHPNAANTYYTLGLYNNAAAAAIRDYNRKSRVLNAIFDTDEHNEYKRTTYFQSLRRATDFCYARFDESKKDRHGTEFLEYADALIANNDSVGSFRIYDYESIQRVSPSLQPLVYNYKATLAYNMLDTAKRSDDQTRLTAYIERFLRSEMVNTSYTFLPDLADDTIPSALPNWAIGALTDYIFEQIGFARQSSLVSAFASDNWAHAIDVAAFSNARFVDFMVYDVAAQRYVLTTTFNDMIAAVNQLSTVLNGFSFSALSDSAKLQYLWYERTLMSAYYSVGSLMSIIGLYNSNSVWTAAGGGVWHVPSIEVYNLMADRDDYIDGYENTRLSFDQHYLDYITTAAAMS